MINKCYSPKESMSKDATPPKGGSGLVSFKGRQCGKTKELIRKEHEQFNKDFFSLADEISNISESQCIKRTPVGHDLKRMAAELNGLVLRYQDIMKCLN